MISSTIYQVPILLLLLAKIGILDITTLKNKRSYVIIGFFYFSSFFDASDPFSQFLVALPMIILYEITIFIIKIFFLKMIKSNLIKEISSPISNELKEFNSFFKSTLESEVKLINYVINYIVKLKGKTV